MDSHRFAILGRFPRRYGHVALALGVCLALSVVLFYMAREREQVIIQAEFEQEAAERVTALQREIDRNLEVLESIGGLFAASIEVERGEFREFVKGPLSYHEDVQALEWIPRVKDSARAAYEEAARNDGIADFQFTERKAEGQLVTAGVREEYFPVYYVEPLKGNETAVGFDLASDSTRLEELERSRDTGAMVATARITLVQEAEEQYGLLVFRPVYRTGAPHETLEERRENHEGFVLGVFRVGDMVEASLKDFPVAGLHLLINDEASLPGERFLYLHKSRIQAPTSVSVDGRRRSGRLDAGEGSARGESAG